MREVREVRTGTWVTAMNAMGYTQNPTLSTLLEAASPGLNVTQKEQEGDRRDILQIVVSAPLDKEVKGRVQLTAGDGIALDPADFTVAVAPGEMDPRHPRPIGETGAGGQERNTISSAGRRFRATF